MSKLFERARCRHRRRARLVVSVVVGMVAVLTAACGTARGSNTDVAAVPTAAAATNLTKAPIVVGSISTDSGPNGNGNAVPVTLRSWQNHVNSNGGIDGHPVTVISQDDAGDPARSVAAVKSMITNDKVLAVLNFSQLSDSWAEFAAQSKVPVLDVANSFHYAKDPNFYPTGTTVLSVIYGIAYAAKQAGSTAFGYFYCAELAACSQALPLQKAATEAVGIPFVTSQAVSSSAPDYTSVCLAAKNAGADAVELALSGTRVPDACAKQGYNPTWVVPSFAFTDTYRTNPNLDGAVGNIGAFPWFLDVPQTQEFRAAMSQYLPDFKGIDSLSLMGSAWVAAKVFQTSLKKVSDAPTSQDVYTGLHSFKDETVGGLAPPLTYAEGQPHSVPCFFLIGIKDRKFVSDTGLKTFCQPQ